MANKTTSKKVQIKQNPRIIGKTLAGGRTALYLEFYGKREQYPKLDSDGNQMYYTTGKMAVFSTAASVSKPLSNS